jgi:hypothetical protein
MAEVYCHIPIRVRITGMPDDDQLDRLATAVERAAAQHIALAVGILRVPYTAACCQARPRSRSPATRIERSRIPLWGSIIRSGLAGGIFQAGIISE